MMGLRRPSCQPDIQRRGKRNRSHGHAAGMHHAHTLGEVGSARARAISVCDLLLGTPDRQESIWRRPAGVLSALGTFHGAKLAASPQRQCRWMHSGQPAGGLSTSTGFWGARKRPPEVMWMLSNSGVLPPVKARPDSVPLPAVTGYSNRENVPSDTASRGGARMSGGKQRQVRRRASRQAALP